MHRRLPGPGLVLIGLAWLAASTQVPGEELAPLIQGVATPAPPLPSLSVFSSDSGDSVPSGSHMWDGYCNECGDSGCFGCQGAGARGLHFVLLADFLDARPTFSQPLAFVRQVRPQGAGPTGIQTSRDDDVNYDFSRTGNLRIGLALRSETCVSEVRFMYWNLEAADTVAGTASTGPDGEDILLNMWDVAAVIPGERLAATARVEGNIYDIVYSRCVQASGQCADSQHCVPWDLHWSAGVRAVDWSIDSSVSRTVAASGRIETARAFEGAGPIIGLDGHRCLGFFPNLSVFAGFNGGLLLGQHDYQLARTTSIGPNQNVEVFSSHQDRVVPVTEFETGIAWQIASAAKVSLGWFHQAWWDLGMEDDPARGDIALHRDRANIMAWNGWTVRGELRF